MRKTNAAGALPPVALLAGGFGRRLGPETARRPKSLVDVNGRPFIWHQLALLRDRGVSSVVVLAGHLGDQVRAAIGEGGSSGVAVRYSDDGPTPLGTGGAVQKALPLLGETFFVLYGDAYLDLDYRDIAATFEESGKLGLITLCPAGGPGGAANVAYVHGRLTGYAKNPPPPGARYVDYGLSLFRRAAFDNFAERGPYDLGEVFSHLIARDQLHPYPVGRRFHEIGSPAGLAEVRALLTRTRA